MLFYVFLCFSFVFYASTISADLIDSWVTKAVGALSVAVGGGSQRYVKICARRPMRVQEASWPLLGARRGQNALQVALGGGRAPPQKYLAAARGTPEARS